jgi:O-antigen ligase
MKLPAKSQKNIDITEYYSINVRSIWNAFKQENAAFKWLCVYFFLEYVRPQTLYPVIDILPYAQISLLLACLFAFTDRSIKWVSNPGNALFILFFIVVILSSAFAFRPSISFGKIDIVINWLVLYFLFLTVITTEKKFIVFLLLFFLVNFKMSQFGFRSFVTRGYTSFGVSGSPGWFKDSGDLGIEMIIFVSLSTAFVLALKDYWGRYKTLFFYFLPLTGLITIIATTSRGAQLGMIAAGLWVLVVSRKIKVFFGVLILGIFLYAILPPEMLGEFESAGEDRTSQARLVLWSWGMDVVREYPILGVGYYNWLGYCYFENPDGMVGIKHCLVAHNTYVTAAAEIGITGLIVYTLLMLFILRLNARTRVNARQSNNTFILYITRGLDAGLIGYMVATIFFSVLYYPMLYVQLTMTVVLNEISKKKVIVETTRFKR